MKHPGGFKPSPWIMGLFIAMLVVANAFVAPDVQAKSSRSKHSATETNQQAEGPRPDTRFNTQRTVSLSFKQLGAWGPISLRGVDTSRTLAFGLRADETVVAAKLRFAFDYSPSLIADLSHLRVLINERVVDLEPLRKDRELGNAREVAIDPRVFRPFNTVRFHGIQHYTRQCEDPFHSSLWITINDNSSLELTLAATPRTGDLKHLPAPFLDKADIGLTNLPFVFGSTPTLGTLHAAGIAASWFGMHAAQRGVQFPVHLNSLPNGNAAVFLEGTSKVDGIGAMAQGASISIQTHPNNPSARLLVIAGGNAEELARAARALALQSPTFTGQGVQIAKETPAAPRKPYDAPAWIPTDRPVRLGEIAKPEDLRIQGYYPDTIRLNYRLPPDVFAWRTPGAPVQLKYRAVRLPTHHNSSLNIGQNLGFIDALALNTDLKQSGDTVQLTLPGTTSSAVRMHGFHIPPYSLNGRNQLQFSYFFDVVKEGECRSLPPDNLQATVDPESTLDFSEFPHYVAMPNLAYFADLGFPFTRMADLSETAVVLPAQPSADEVSLYLAVMGRMGEATAYPALRHALISPADTDKFSDHDLIVIGSGNRQELFRKWADSLPIIKINGERKVREPVSHWFPTYRWEQQDVRTQPNPQGNLHVVGGADMAALMAFESPLKPQRSVVALYADQSSDLSKISQALTSPDQFSIQGDLAVVDEKSADYAKVAPTYYLGALPQMSKLRWFFTDQPLLAALLLIAICVLLAILSYRLVRRLAGKSSQQPG